MATHWMKVIPPFYHAVHGALNPVGDVPLGTNQQRPGNPYNPFVGATTGRGRQNGFQLICAVDANDGKVTGVELPDVRATSQGDGLLAMRVRIRAEAFDKHIVNLTIVSFCVNPLCRLLSLMSEQARPDAICAEVATLLRARRVEKGLTTTEVARRAGLSQQMVSYVEKRARKPTLDTLFRMAQAMEIDLWPLVKDAEERAK